MSHPHASATSVSSPWLSSAALLGCLLTLLFLSSCSSDGSKDHHVGPDPDVPDRIKVHGAEDIEEQQADDRHSLNRPVPGPVYSNDGLGWRASQQ